MIERKLMTDYCWSSNIRATDDELIIIVPIPNTTNQGINFQLYDTEIDSALTFAEEASISDLVSNFINTSKIMQAMLL